MSSAPSHAAASSDGDAADGPPPAHSLPRREFILLLALLTAMTAMSIDIMLPALPEIGRALGVANPNDLQLVVIVYFSGLAAGQLFWGPVSDRFGRRAPLLAGLAVYVGATLLATLAPSFDLLLLARLVQGFGGGASRTIATAIIRDLYAGRQMAQVISTVMMVFICVPILAPAVGQGAMRLGSWAGPFYVLLTAGSVAAVWSAWRLPETRKTAGQPPFSLAGALRLVLGSTVTCGYGAAAGLTLGCLITYISSAQQIFGGLYRLGDLFPYAFGGIAMTMLLAYFTNSRLVQRLGMRRLSHLALVAFLATSCVLMALSSIVHPPLVVYGSLLAVCFYLFGLMQPNFNAIAMQPVGHAAGTASSLLGSFTTVTGAVLGGMIARQFNGTVLPLAAGFAILSACALMCIVAVEGRSGLFRGE